MDLLQSIVDFLNTWVVDIGINVGGEPIPFAVILLLGTGFYLTARLGFVQLRRLGHGFAVTTGMYDDPNEPGDVSHFQALTTALSATVGIGNIAGVALAIHLGGPGALFWMWVTAFLGMATKYSEVTLAQKYRDVDAEGGAHKWEGAVSGGPMYYIEKGLGPKWRPMAVFFAAMLAFTAFLTGNAVQANTVADNVQSVWGISPYLTGLITAGIVGTVILGGIQRIGRVTSILAPLMAAVYVAGAMFIILRNIGDLVPTIMTIFAEAFNPSAGVAGTGIGVFVVTMMWGVRRGLFSNEAGQGSAPIAHAAAKTDEPVSEGVVALLEPFIDTILICSMTGIVIIMTGMHTARLPTEVTLRGGDLGYTTLTESGRYVATDAPAEIRIENGIHVQSGVGAALVSWHETAIDTLYTNQDMTQPFTGVVRAGSGEAVSDAGQSYASLWGNAPESGAPLTMEAFSRGLPGTWGNFIVLISTILFAVSTAISWSYYGDRCANYLFGHKAVLPYKFVYVAMHYMGAVVPLAVVWAMGDIALAIVIIPNLIALIFLAPQVVEMTKSYFERRPWEENARVHQEIKKRGKA
jgi:AGCS family alanine or glycine:cation symporter